MENLTRRWLIATAAVAATLLALAACGNDPPEGVDGELTDGWEGFSELVGFTPDAPVCHAQPYQRVAPLVDYQPVDCDEPHLVETVHVGTFADDAAELESPPARDSSEHRDAYGVCEEQVADYLGADFRQGRLWLGVAVPSQPGWDGGARWFRCELMEVESVYGDTVERTGTLAGALGGETDDPGLRLGCYQVSVEDGAVEQMTPVGCDESHAAEFVGVWRASGGAYPDPEDGDAESEVYAGCREQVAEYVDVPVDEDLVFRTGTVADWMSEEDWQAGDHGFRCYLWLPDQELTESLEDAGADALPVQTE